MTHEERVILVGRLQEWFQKGRVVPIETDLSSVDVSRTDKLSHLASMLTRIEQFIAARQYSKADRWIGFVQGSLWGGDFSINDFRKMNTFD